MSILPSSRKLNLGSGEFSKDGFVNVDYYSISNPDISHDLNKFPYPFDDNYFELVEADHILEHLDEPFAVMRELHRICAPGATIHIRVPHFSRGFTHAEHKRGFDVTFPYYFDPTLRLGYQRVSLKLIKMRLRWFAQPYLKKTLLSTPLFILGQTGGAFLDFFANLSPWLCSRLWCFWVGGFEEIEFIFQVDK
jgi:predicted SAM-dependent methyltransferase